MPFRPRRLQCHHDAAIVEAAHLVLRHCWPEQIAAQLFQARAIRVSDINATLSVDHGARRARGHCWPPRSRVSAARKGGLATFALRPLAGMVHIA